MNTARSTPSASALADGTWNGLNHDNDGWIELGAPCPVQTRTSATTETATSMIASIPSRAYCTCAESSMPM